MEAFDSLSFLGYIGVDLPRTERELLAFEELYRNYVPKGDANKLDCQVIWRKSQLKPTVINGSSYFKRTVLAAEILYHLHKEPTMGRLKLQKLIFLCQHTSQMQLHTNFLKQAMGPYDPKMMRSLESQMKKSKWFIYRPNDSLKYHPLENFGGHREWYSKYFHDEQENIDYLINLFRTERTRTVELVATIFDVWQITESENQLISSAHLVSMVYDYSIEKQKFSEAEILRTIRWMVEIQLHPKKSRIIGL